MKVKITMTKPLSLRETYHIWGGFGGQSRLEHGPVVYKDISGAAVEISPGLPKEARVAVIHLGIPYPMMRRLMAGGTLRLKREIIASGHLLRDLGYTHIAVSGPLLKRIRIDKYLTEISSHKNNRLIVSFSIFGACAAFGLAGLLILPFQSRRNKTPGFLTFARVSRSGFKNTVIYRLQGLPAVQ